MEWMYEWIGSSYFTNILLVVLGISILSTLNNIRVILLQLDRITYKNLPNIESILYIMYRNNEERLKVSSEDIYPRNTFDDWHQERYGYETSAEQDARYKYDADKYNGQTNKKNKEK